MTMHSFAFRTPVLALLATTSMMNSALAQPIAVSSQPTLSTRDQIAAYVSEASRRFGISEAWIAAVMRVESAGDPSATSHAGAIGLMQVMPTTYATLRARLGLGANAYDPHDNIMAGAAYIRKLHDRYGDVGFLAAYNAGPGRWEGHLAGVRPLPPETIRYMARLAPMLGRRDATILALAVAPTVLRPEAAPIFVVLSRKGGTNLNAPTSRGLMQIAAAEPSVSLRAADQFYASGSAFVPPTDAASKDGDAARLSSRPRSQSAVPESTAPGQSSLFVRRTPSREPSR